MGRQGKTYKHTGKQGESRKNRKTWEIGKNIEKLGETEENVGKQGKTGRIRIKHRITLVIS